MLAIRGLRNYPYDSFDSGDGMVFRKKRWEKLQSQNSWKSVWSIGYLILQDIPNIRSHPYLEDHPRTCKWLTTMVIVTVP